MQITMIFKKFWKKLNDIIEFITVESLLRLFVSISAIAYLISFNLENIHYQLIVTGEYHYVTMVIFPLFLLSYYVAYTLHKVLNKFEFWVNMNRYLKEIRWFSVLTILLLWPLPFWFFFGIYPQLYYSHYDSAEQEYLKKSHTEIGLVYQKRVSVDARSYSNAFYVGIDKQHQREHRVSKKLPIAQSVHAGDTVILQVSDEYPRVNKVLNWQPTHKEIVKYKKSNR